MEKMNEKAEELKALCTMDVTRPSAIGYLSLDGDEAMIIGVKQMAYGKNSTSRWQGCARTAETDTAFVALGGKFSKLQIAGQCYEPRKITVTENGVVFEDAYCKCNHHTVVVDLATGVTVDGVAVEMDAKHAYAMAMSMVERGAEAIAKIEAMEKEEAKEEKEMSKTSYTMACDENEEIIIETIPEKDPVEEAKQEQERQAQIAESRRINAERESVISAVMACCTECQRPVLPEDCVCHLLRGDVMANHVSVAVSGHDVVVNEVETHGGDWTDSVWYRGTVSEELVSSMAQVAIETTIHGHTEPVTNWLASTTDHINVGRHVAMSITNLSFADDVASFNAHLYLDGRPSPVFGDRVVCVRATKGGLSIDGKGIANGAGAVDGIRMAVQRILENNQIESQLAEI